MLRHPKLLLAWSAAWLAAWSAAAFAQITVPSGFVVENAVPGAAFDTPTGIAFLPDGRMLVSLKEGTAWMVQNGTKQPGPLADLRRVVLNQGDRGLLGVAVDPNFNTNRYLYFLYVVDPDSDLVDTMTPTYSRLVRYQLPVGSNIVDTTTRAVLFGRTWAEGPPSASETHTVGALRWGVDGSLMVSVGEGAHFDGVDRGGESADQPLFLPGRTNPLEDIGAYRAQYVNSLAGKILRLDPATGLGYSSNPYYDGNPASVRSRVYAYGLRNPFRFCMRPGTGNVNPSQGRPGSIYLGDVGWDTKEELSIATQPGMNFGWPCREGLNTTAYVGSTPPARCGCTSLGTADNPATVFTPPVSDWHHYTSSLSSPAGVVGNAAAGSAFYSGTSYPGYQGRYFYADFGQSWIRTATVDANDNIISYAAFGDDLDNPVDLVADPVSKDIYYVSISTGQVRRIRYFGAQNGTPTAMATATPQTGGLPLSVTFSSAGSSDPNGDPLEYIWDFGDGSGSFLANPTHVYTTSGAFAPTLTVSDLHGGYNSKVLQVTVGDAGAFPGTAVLDNFERPNGSLASPWSNAGGAAIANHQLKATASSSEPIWTPQFGADQEAYYTFANNSGGEFHINLKMQYGSPSASHIEVSSAAGTVRISTFDDTGVGWVMRGPPIAVTFNTGDTFGARVYGSTVHIFKNGALAGTRSVAGWQFVNNPGYIGLAMINANTNTRLDNWGGGTFVPAVNTPPIAIIASPADNSFYVEGQAINLAGDASDGQTAAAQMGYHWDVALHHNNHTHPGQLVSDNRNEVFMPQSHEDGSGTWLQTTLVVTDGGGLKDTATVSLWPEVDLDPSPVTVTPDPARRIDVNQFSFNLRNDGRMLSRTSHWALLAGDSLLAEGDTLVAPLDSLAISIPVNVFLDPGTYPLRLVADSLGVVHELSETNNARMGTLTVVNGPVAVGSPLPRVASLSAGIPNPTARSTRFWLVLPRSARVSMIVHDVQGRRVWSSPPREYGAGRWQLEWDAAAQRPGVYLLQTQAGEHRWTRRIAVVR